MLFYLPVNEFPDKALCLRQQGFSKASVMCGSFARLG